MFSCEYCEIFKSSCFLEHLRWLLLQMFCFNIIFTKRRCWIYCSYTLHNCFALRPKITLIHFNRVHSLCHWLSFVVPLVVIRCHSLSLIVIRCHSFYHSLSLVVLIVVTCCHLLYHSLSFVITRCTTCLSFYKRSFWNGFSIIPLGVKSSQKL